MKEEKKREMTQKDALVKAPPYKNCRRDACGTDF